MTSKENTSDNSEDKKTIPVTREDISVGKKKVDTANVNVKKIIHQEDLFKDIHLKSEKVKISRKKKNIELSDTPEIRKKGNVTIIPVVKEVVVKKQILVEEIHIEKVVERGTKTIHEKLKSEEVQINREELK